MINQNDKSLVIIGASGLGKEIAWLARRAQVPVKGFLDDNAALHGAGFCGIPVLGGSVDWIKHNDCMFVVAIAAPRIRSSVVKRMHAEGQAEFATLIDPSVQFIPDEVKIGAGSVVCAGSVLTMNVKIGQHCVINKLVSVGHDVDISDFVTVAPQVMLGGFVHLSNGAEIGAGSQIRQGLSVCVGAMVGMGSVVTKIVEKYTLVVGNPARELKKLEEFLC